MDPLEPPLTFNDWFPKWFDRYLVFHSVFTVGLFILHCLYIIFAPGFWNHFIYTCIFSICLACINFIIDTIGNYLLATKTFQHPKYYKALMAATLGIICVLGFVMRVGVFFVGWDYYILLFSLFSTLFATMFLYRDNVKYDVFYFVQQKTIPTLFVIHIVLFVASLRFATAFASGWDLAAIIGFQVLFFPMSLFANVDMVMIIVGATHWFGDGLEEQDEDKVAAVECGAEEEKGEPIIIECTICLQPYSTDNTPRILKECGHTICTSCVTRLLEPNNNYYVFCPICRMVTVVRGPATKIPQNHSILGLLKELKKKRTPVVEVSNEQQPEA